MQRILVYEDNEQHFEALLSSLRGSLPLCEVVWFRRDFPVYRWDVDGRPLRIAQAPQIEVREEHRPLVFSPSGKSEGAALWWPSDFVAAVIDVYEQRSDLTVGLHYLDFFQRAHFAGPVVICSQKGNPDTPLQTARQFDKREKGWLEQATEWLSDAVEQLEEPVCGAAGRNRANPQEIRRYWEFVRRRGKSPRRRSAAWIGEDTAVQRIFDVLLCEPRWFGWRCEDPHEWLGTCRRRPDVPNLLFVDFGSEVIEHPEVFARGLGEQRELWAADSDLIQPLVVLFSESFGGLDDAKRRQLHRQGAILVQRSGFVKEPFGWVIDTMQRFSRVWAECLDRSRKKGRTVAQDDLLNLFEAFLTVWVLAGGMNYAVGERNRPPIPGMVSWLADIPGTYTHINVHTVKFLPAFFRGAHGAYVDSTDRSQDIVNRRVFRALGALRTVDPDYELPGR